jgi:hypothetical protein
MSSLTFLAYPDQTRAETTAERVLDIKMPSSEFVVQKNFCNLEIVARFYRGKLHYLAAAALQYLLC